METEAEFQGGKMGHDADRLLNKTRPENAAADDDIDIENAKANVNGFDNKNGNGNDNKNYKDKDKEEKRDHVGGMVGESRYGSSAFPTTFPSSSGSPSKNSYLYPRRNTDRLFSMELEDVFGCSLDDDEGDEDPFMVNDDDDDDAVPPVAAAVSPTPSFDEPTNHQVDCRAVSPTRRKSSQNQQENQNQHQNQHQQHQAEASISVEALWRSYLEASSANGVDFLSASLVEQQQQLQRHLLTQHRLQQQQQQGRQQQNSRSPQQLHPIENDFHDSTSSSIYNHHDDDDEDDGGTSYYNGNDRNNDSSAAMLAMETYLSKATSLSPAQILQLTASSSSADLTESIRQFMNNNNHNNNNMTSLSPTAGGDDENDGSGTTFDFGQDPSYTEEQLMTLAASISSLAQSQNINSYGERNHQHHHSPLPQLSSSSGPEETIIFDNGGYDNENENENDGDYDSDYYDEDDYNAIFSNRKRKQEQPSVKPFDDDHSKRLDGTKKQHHESDDGPTAEKKQQEQRQHHQLSRFHSSGILDADVEFYDPVVHGNESSLFRPKQLPPPPKLPPTREQQKREDRSPNDQGPATDKDEAETERTNRSKPTEPSRSSQEMTKTTEAIEDGKGIGMSSKRASRTTKQDENVSNKAPRSASRDLKRSSHTRQHGKEKRDGTGQNDNDGTNNNNDVDGNDDEKEKEQAMQGRNSKLMSRRPQVHQHRSLKNFRSASTGKTSSLWKYRPASMSAIGQRRGLDGRPQTALTPAEILALTGQSSSEHLDFSSTPSSPEGGAAEGIPSGSSTDAAVDNPNTATSNAGNTTNTNTTKPRGMVSKRLKPYSRRELLERMSSNSSNVSSMSDQQSISSVRRQDDQPESAENSNNKNNKINKTNDPEDNDDDRKPAAVPSEGNDISSASSAASTPLMRSSMMSSRASSIRIPPSLIVMEVDDEYDDDDDMDDDYDNDDIEGGGGSRDDFDEMDISIRGPVRRRSSSGADHDPTSVPASRIEIQNAPPGEGGREQDGRDSSFAEKERISYTVVNDDDNNPNNNNTNGDDDEGSLEGIEPPPGAFRVVSGSHRSLLMDSEREISFKSVDFQASAVFSSTTGAIAQAVQAERVDETEDYLAKQELEDRLEAMERQISRAVLVSAVTYQRRRSSSAAALLTSIAEVQRSEQRTSSASASASAPSPSRRRSSQISIVISRREILKWFVRGSLLVGLITIVLGLTIVLPLVMRHVKNKDDSTSSGGGGIESLTPTQAPVAETDIAPTATTIPPPPSGSSPSIPTPAPAPTTPILLPTLEAIQQRGYISCRVESFERRRGYGFSMDLCRALSAAIFDGDANRTSYPSISWSKHFAFLHNGTLDVTTAQATYTMERDVREPGSGAGLDFTSPYFYSGTLFAGLPSMVECAERGETLLGECFNLRVCVIEDSTNKAAVADHLDGAAIRLTLDGVTLLQDLANDVCNVIAGEPSLIYEERVREAGYTGDYTFGSLQLSKEPIAIVTREGNNAKFSDFCNWIVQSLITADALNITQDRAYEFPTTHLFGDEYKQMFRHAIAAIGNYGELYERYFEDRYPRSGMNLISRPEDVTETSGGLMYANPFGNLKVELELENQGVVELRPNGTIETVMERGYLRCGIIGNRPGFATFVVANNTNNKNNTDETTNDDNGDWYGLDVEFCRAISAALFSADIQRVEFVNVHNISNGFVLLNSTDIDILAGANYTMENDVREPTTATGYTFGPIYFYGNTDGEGVIGNGTGEVVNGTLVNGTTLGGSYALAMATRQDDDEQWSAFARWVVWSTVVAEERGISSFDAVELPVLDLFGNGFQQMFRFVSLMLGNYGDIYERSLGSIIPRSGRNLLSDGSPKLLPIVSSFFLRDNETIRK